MSTATVEKPLFTINTPRPITRKQLMDFMIAAFESSSNFSILKTCPPAGTTRADFKEGGKHTLADYYPSHFLIATAEGGHIVIQDNQEEPEDEDNYTKYNLGLEQLQKGLEALAVKCPSHFNDFIEENDDVNTSLAFIECCLFGDVIYC